MNGVRVIRTIFEPPLLETNEANVIEFRDNNGQLEALVTRVLGGELWCFACKSDKDWEQTLLRHGYLKSGTVTIADLIKKKE